MQTLQISWEGPDHQRVTYSLVAVVVHKKISRHSGHYVAFFRSPVTDKQWIHADDEKVCHI